MSVRALPPGKDAPRGKNGRRDYAEGDVAWIQFICHLKETGMRLRDIQCYAELRYAGDRTMPERLEMLLAHREYVLEQQRRWRDCLQKLDGKIAFYRQSIGAAEDICL